MRIVLKFGGTSLMDHERVLRAAARAAELAQQGAQVVVVVSAWGHTTDALLQQAAPFPENRRERDALLAAGEQMSAALMAMAVPTPRRWHWRRCWGRTFAASIPMWMGSTTKIPGCIRMRCAMTVSAMMPCWRWQKAVPRYSMIGAWSGENGTACPSMCCLPSGQARARW